MPHLTRALLLVASLPVLAAAAPAQQTSTGQLLNAPARLLAARKLYYTPTAHGLTSFRCNATVDWKAMLTRFSGSPIANDNPFLIFLQGVRMEVSDNLDGDGKLLWTETTAPPANLQTNRDQMRDGMLQMISGFYQSWNQFMNGGMVPAPDNSTTETNNDDGGLHMHGKDSSTVFDEDFDKNMLLLSAHVLITGADHSKDLDNTAYPTYETSTEGLRVNKVRNVLHQPPSAPATEVSMAVAYAPVGTFQLPSTLAVTLVGTGEFDFSFNSCTVNPAAKP